MVGRGRPLLREILGQPNPFGSQSPIFNRRPIQRSVGSSFHRQGAAYLKGAIGDFQRRAGIGDQE